LARRGGGVEDDDGDVRRCGRRPLPATRILGEVAVDRILDVTECYRSTVGRDEMPQSAAATMVRRPIRFHEWPPTILRFNVESLTPGSLLACDSRSLHSLLGLSGTRRTRYYGGQRHGPGPGEITVSHGPGELLQAAGCEGDAATDVGVMVMNAMNVDAARVRTGSPSMHGRRCSGFRAMLWVSLAAAAVPGRAASQAPLAS